MFLEDCKYVVKEKMMPVYINVKTENSPDHSDEENFDEENSIKNMNILFLNMNINFIYHMHWICR